MNNKILFFFCCLQFSLCVRAQSMLDLLSFRQSKQENVEYQLKILKRWKIRPDIVAVFKPDGKDSMINCKFNIDTHMCRQNTFSPIQFRVYENNGKLFTAWEYCFGNMKILGTLKERKIYDIAHLPLNRNVTFEQDSCLWLSVTGPVPDIASYRTIIIAYWDPYFGRSVRKMLQRVQHVIDANPQIPCLFITVNYNGALDVTASVKK